ncbi:hypothetical protein GQ55_7G091700 [Panicum hallii var. hallii]|uniref:Uncharacterized protein n=1 Tax=Panicum hallii var. hallii TaxID=1504633 RepID=A0A2T7CTB8_9POAL|nr:hypothetical protein GQ55_7G091700 [Panicum hallii var. hallii]
MERSPVATPPEIEEGLSSGSPSARTPRVEVLMPLNRISPTNRTKISTTDLTRINRLKQARCVVGSPSIRIINQIQLSTPTTRSPKNSTIRNSCAGLKGCLDLCLGRRATPRHTRRRQTAHKCLRKEDMAMSWNVVTMRWHMVEAGMHVAM